ncbi:MAG: gspG [Candidatus Nomurabacteria bacterium]|nr:gspG [Candidatus Nomurabacteria bacterium]
MLFGLLGSKKTYIPKWVSFERTVNSKPFAITVDTGHKNLLDQKEYKNILVATFSSIHPDPQGMPDVSEKEIITKVAQHLLEELAANTQVFFLGTIYGEEKAMLYYAMLQPVEEAIVLAGIKGVALEHIINWAEDSHWEFIKNTLYPSEQESQHLMNVTMLDLVKFEHDKKSEQPDPHGVAHTMFFKESESALRLVEELKVSGYYQIGRIQTVKGDTNMPFLLELGKDTPMELGSIDDQTSILIDMAKKYNGRYDGWRAIQGNIGAAGFTLIELLVVIAIIGILASVILASLNTARDKGRYAQAISQMEEITKAAELDVKDNGNYPPDIHQNLNPGLTAMTQWPTPPCPGWTYDWENWDTRYGGNVNTTVNTVRITLRRPDVTSAFYYCVESLDPTCGASVYGGVDINTVRTLTCKE